MKKSLTIAVSVILTFASCERFFINPDDYLFKADNGLKYKYTDFELYDSSTHIFYLKKSHPEFKYDKAVPFSFLANGETIYKGVFWPMYSSSFPTGPYISAFSSFYPDFTIKIEHMTLDNKPIDPRNDPRIISALSDRNLLHSGLSITINSIDISPTQLTFKFTVTNKDLSNLMIMDLEKTGLNLFHYFTNGLSIRTLTYEEVFSGKITSQVPSPWDSFSTTWLSELKSGASKQFTINYPLSSPINPGNYTAAFEFPGINLGLTRDNLYINNARIWIGDIYLTKRVTIP